MATAVLRMQLPPPELADALESVTDVDGIIVALIGVQHHAGVFARRMVTKPTDLPQLRAVLCDETHGPISVRDLAAAVLAAVRDSRLAFPSGFLQCALSDDVPVVPVAHCTGDLRVRAVRWSRRQLRCITAHQFVGMLKPGSWHTEDHFVNTTCWHAGDTSASFAYLRCQLHYLLSTREMPPTWLEQCVSIALGETGTTPPLHEWQTRTKLLSPFCVTTRARIEDAPPFSTQMDFANKCVGFGPWGTQEELMMGMCPELCAASLCLPPLKDSKCARFCGVQQVADYSGYGSSVSLASLIDPTEWKQKDVVAIDAVDLSGALADADSAAEASVPELTVPLLERELNKLACGFAMCAAHAASEEGRAIASVSTGAWGCGAFGGTRVLKAVLQWAAASEANVALIYNAVHDTEFATQLTALADGYVGKCTNGTLLSAILSGYDRARKEDWRRPIGSFTFAELLPTGVLEDSGGFAGTIESVAALPPTDTTTQRLP